MKRDPTTGAPDFFSFARDYLHTYLPTWPRRCHRRRSRPTGSAWNASWTTWPTTEHVERAHVSFDHFDRQHLKAWLAWMTDQQALRAEDHRAAAQRHQSVPGLLLPARTSPSSRSARQPRPSRPRPAPGSPIEYLTEPETRAVLAAFTGRTAKSRRNRMLLILLYDTAARVGEITGPDPAGPRLTKPGHVTLTGKRNKTRIVPLTGKTIEHLRVYLAEFHPDAARLPATRPLFYSLHHGQPTALSTDTVAAVLKPGRPTARQDCPIDPRAHPLPHAAQDQGHGPLPARHPAADHHATPRPREHIDHRGVLRVRHPRHDAASRQRRHPRDQRPATAPLTDDKLQALYSLR